MKVLGNRIFVEVDSEAQKSGGGLLLRRKHRPNATGRAVGVGTRFGLPIETGARVVFRPYAGRDVEVEGKTYRMLEPADVLGVIPDRAEVEPQD